MRRQRWFMKSARVVFLAFSLGLVVSACGGGKPKNKVALEEAKPGRDLELFRDGITAIRKGSYDQGRMLINTSINTYPDSPLIRVAKLSIADSFYMKAVQRTSPRLMSSITTGFSSSPRIRSRSR